MGSIIKEFVRRFFYGENTQTLVSKGGAGSGNAGHAGIPGHQGGSLPAGMTADQYSEERAQGRDPTHSNSRHRHDAEGKVQLKSTEEIYSEKITDPDGKQRVRWKPSRAKLHEKIINAALAKAVRRSDATPELILMGGGSAVGKTGVREKMVLPELAGQGIVPVVADPDGVKAELPEYQQWVEEGNESAAMLAHEESSFVSKEIIRRAELQGLDILIDGTMSNPTKYKGYVDKYGVQMGWNVRAVVVDCDYDVAVARERARAEATGRHVKEDAFKATHANVPSTFNAIRDAKGLASWVAYDTTIGKIPRVFAYRMSGGETTILDSEAWSRLQNKGNMTKGWWRR